MFSSIGSCSGAGRSAASLPRFEVERNLSDGNFTWKVRRWISRSAKKFLSGGYVYIHVPVKLVAKWIWVEAGLTTHMDESVYVYIVMLNTKSQDKIMANLLWTE